MLTTAAEQEEELAKMEKELEEQMDTAHALLQAKKDLTVEVAHLKENLKSSDAAEVLISHPCVC